MEELEQAILAAVRAKPQRIPEVAKRVAAGQDGRERASKTLTLQLVERGVLEVGDDYLVRVP